MAGQRASGGSWGTVLTIIGAFNDVKAEIPQLVVGKEHPYFPDLIKTCGFAQFWA